MSWREASAAVRRAYDRWRGEHPRDRGLAFASYGAALDREEREALTFCEFAEALAGALPDGTRPGG